MIVKIITQRPAPWMSDTLEKQRDAAFGKAKRSKSSPDWIS